MTAEAINATNGTWWDTLAYANNATRSFVFNNKERAVEFFSSLKRPTLADGIEVLAKGVDAVGKVPVIGGGVLLAATGIGLTVYHTNRAYTIWQRSSQQVEEFSSRRFLSHAAFALGGGALAVFGAASVYSLTRPAAAVPETPVPETFVPVTPVALPPPVVGVKEVPMSVVEECFSNVTNSTNATQEVVNVTLPAIVQETINVTNTTNITQEVVKAIQPEAVNATVPAAVQETLNVTNSTNTTAAKVVEAVKPKIQAAAEAIKEPVKTVAKKVAKSKVVKQ